MRTRAAPTPLRRALDQPRAQWIQFDIACSRQKVRLVHDKGSKPPLPQIPAPFLAEIDPPRVTPVRLADRSSQPLLRRRNGNQMDMIGHEAITPYFHPLVTAPISHQFQIRRVISVVKEGRLATVSPLGYMVRDPRNYH